MKRWLGIFLIYLFAVSSGITQFSFHSCKKDGLHVLNHQCDTDISHSDAKIPKDCCRKTKALATEEIGLCNQNLGEIKCCEINYFFGFAPLPQKISKFQLNKSHSYCVEYQDAQINAIPNAENQFHLNRKIPPKPGITENNRVNNHQASIQVWVI